MPRCDQEALDQLPPRPSPLLSAAFPALAAFPFDALGFGCRGAGLAGSPLSGDGRRSRDVFRRSCGGQGWGQASGAAMAPELQSGPVGGGE